MYSGSTTRFQIGLESVYGTAVPATLELPGVSWDINEEPESLESRANVGTRFPPQARRGMSKVKGTITFELNPDIMGTIAWLICGAEAAAAPVAGHVGAYDHVFTPRTTASLPSFTGIGDKGPDVFTYTGLKVASAKFSFTTKDIATCTLEVTGQQELLTGSLASLTISSKAPFTYKGFTAFTGAAGTAAATAAPDVEMIDVSYDNKLDAERYRANGTTYTGEIDHNGCEARFSVKADLTAATNTIRETYSKVFTPLAMRAAYQTEEQVATTNYAITFDMLYGNIVPFGEPIPGPDRLSVNFDVLAKDGTNGAFKITVRDGYDNTIVGIPPTAISDLSAADNTDGTAEITFTDAVGMDSQSLFWMAVVGGETAAQIVAGGTEVEDPDGEGETVATGVGDFGFVVVSTNEGGSVNSNLDTVSVTDI